MYCGVCSVPHDRPTLSISTSVTLRYIRGSRWPNGLGVCLARRMSWVRVPRRHIPRFFLSGYLLCGSRLSKSNCNILGLENCSFHIHWLYSSQIMSTKRSFYILGSQNVLTIIFVRILVGV